jgi:hypothetical protein
MFEQTFKNIDDILHKDAGCGSAKEEETDALEIQIKTNLESLGYEL